MQLIPCRHAAVPTFRHAQSHQATSTHSLIREEVVAQLEQELATLLAGHLASRAAPGFSRFSCRILRCNLAQHVGVMMTDQTATPSAPNSSHNRAHHAVLK